MLLVIRAVIIKVYSKGCIDFNSEYLQGPAVTVSWQWCVTREIQQVMDGAEC